MALKRTMSTRTGSALAMAPFTFSGDIIVVMVEISIVIPVKNEAGNIKPLVEELTREMSFFGTWECIWVDDASDDLTPKILDDIAENDAHHRIVRFEEAAGQSAAYWEAFRRANGILIATMDGDGQNDPADIPRLARLVISGVADMAHGYRKNRRDSFVRILSSKIGCGLMNAVTGVGVRDVGCATRVFKRECVAYLPRFSGLHRFMARLVMMNGYLLVDIPVTHRPRVHGKSKYGIGNRIWIVVFDILGVWWLQKRGLFYRVKVS